MKKVVASLFALVLLSSAPPLVSAFGGGVSGVSVGGCGGCHVDIGGIEVQLDCPAAVAPGQTVVCNLAVNGSPTGGGGFNASATSGMLSAGTNSQILAGEATHSGGSPRTWSFSWTAPDMATEAMIRVAAMGSNADGAISGDAWALASAAITVTAGGDTDGDGWPDDEDCAPTDPSVHPGADEICDNGIDDDCDGAIDDEDADCNPLIIVLGDVAPRGMPDGVVNVLDAILVLRFAVGLDIPTAEELALADVAPGMITDPTAVPPIFIPTPDGQVNVGDVVVTLRQAVALIRLLCRPLPEALPSSASSDHVPTGSLVSVDSSQSVEAQTRTWSLSRPAGSAAMLGDSEAVVTSFTPDVEGTYTVSLTIGNCAGNSTASIHFTASSVYSAGAVDSSNYDAMSSGIGMRVLSGRTQYTTNLGASDARLSAGESFGVGATTHRWEQIGGPPVELSDPDSPNPTFEAPTVADILANREGGDWGVAALQYHELELIFELTVTAGGQSDISTVSVYLEYGGYELPPRGPFLNVARGSRVWLEGAPFETDGDPIEGWNWQVIGPTGDPSPALEGNGTRAPSFVPMVEGVYEVRYEVSAVGLSGDGVAEDSGSFLLTSAEWAGSGIGDDARPTCAACHDGSVMPDMMTEFIGSAHSGEQFALLVARSGLSAKSTASIAFLDPSKNPAAYELENPTYCLRCHTGWDPSPLADNGGLDDLLVETGFEVPPGGITWERVLADYPRVANVAGQQCEVCHGPGSQHDGNLNANAMSVTIDSMVCGQCHDDQVQEWLGNSGHSQNYRRDSTNCFPCHAGEAFIAHADGEPLTAALGRTPSVHGCAVCHDPHSRENPHQLRMWGEVKMPEGQVFHRGAGAGCLECHDGRYANVESSALTSSRGPHGNQQGPMLLGVGFTRNFSTGALELDESAYSFHGRDEFILGNFVDGGSPFNDACVTCHMAAGPYGGQSGSRKVGGHTHRTVSREVLGVLTDSAADGPAELMGESALVTVPGADFLTTLADIGEDSVLDLVITSAESSLGEHRILDFTNTTLTLRRNLHVGDRDPIPYTATAWRIEEVEAFDNVSACAPCHSNLTDFNRMARADYDGNGLVEGVQDEVRGLLDILGSKIVAIDLVDHLYPDPATEARCDGVNPGRGTAPANWVNGSTLQKTGGSAGLCRTSNDVLLALYNWGMVLNDGSLGVHNTGFTVQLLQRTYTALSEAYPAVDDPNSGVDDAGKSFAEAYPMATIR